MANVVISLNANGGVCSQNGSNGDVGIIDVSASRDTVTFESAAAVAGFQISFTSGCPFAACPVISSNGLPVNVGSPNAAAANQIFLYSSVTLGSTTYNNPAQLGIHVKP